MIKEANINFASAGREQTYQAAHDVAAAVEFHFARHRANASQLAEQELASTPDAQTIAAMPTQSLSGPSALRRRTLAENLAGVCLAGTEGERSRHCAKCSD